MGKAIKSKADIYLRVDPAVKEDIMQAAEEARETMVGYILTAVWGRMKQEGRTIRI